MYQKYLDPQRQFADLIVGEETDIAATILSSRIREIFKEKDSGKETPVSESKNFEASYFVRN